MTLSDFRSITDELLSAYIDDEVTEQERTLVEAAIAAEEEIAWRVDSLRQTVNLLQDLPELALPRSFTLSFDPVRATQTERQLEGVAVGGSPVEQRQVALPVPRTGSKTGNSPGFWDQLQQGWREFWQAGNPLLRNAAAVSFALMLMLTSGGPIFTRALTQTVGINASAPAAPASSEAAPADVVALVPAVPLETQETTQETTDEAVQSQETDAAGKQGADANARIMTANAASDESQSDEPDSAAQDAAAGGTPESATTESAAPAEEPTEDAVAEGEAATGAEVTAERAASEPAAAAAMMAPPQVMPAPGAPSGMGGGSGGDGPDMILVPSQAYAYEQAPALRQTPVPAEEAVGASVAAVPEEDISARSSAAVSAPATTEVTTEAASDATSRMAVPESPVAQSTQSETQSETVASEASVPEQPTVEPTVDPTVAAVALVAPEVITSSVVVEDAPADSTVAVANTSRNLPVLWVAQGGAFLLTIMLVSLWWRSRTPRRYD